MPVFTNINVAGAATGEGGLTATLQEGVQFIAQTNGFNVDSPGIFGDDPIIFGYAGAYKLDSVLFVLRQYNSGFPTSMDFTVSIYEGPLVNSTPITNYTLLGTSAPTAIPNTANNISNSVPHTFSNFTPEVFLTNGQTYAAVVQAQDNDTRIRFSNSTFSDGVGMSVFSGTVSGVGGILKPFRVNMEGDAGAVNDPLIRTLSGGSYYLPVDEKMYCLIDTRDHEDRLIINIKCHIRRCGKSYIRYIFVYYNGCSFTIRLPNLVRVDTVVSNLNELVEKGQLPPHKNQRVAGKNVSEVQRNGKVRKYLLKTKKFGDFHLIFNRGKFRFNLRGNPSQLNTENSVGCMKGEDHVMEISRLNFIPGIPSS